MKVKNSQKKKKCLIGELEEIFWKLEQKVENKIEMIKLYPSKKSNNSSREIKKQILRKKLSKIEIQNFPELKDMSL